MQKQINQNRTQTMKTTHLTNTRNQVTETNNLTNNRTQTMNKTSSTINKTWKHKTMNSNATRKKIMDSKTLSKPSNILNKLNLINSKNIMKTHSITKKTIVVAVALTLGACASNSDKKLEIGFEPGSCRFFKSEEVAPDWVCAPQRLFENGYWHEVGMGNAAHIDPNFQKKSARQNAREELATRAAVKVASEYVKDNYAHLGEEEQMMVTETLKTKITTEFRLPSTEQEAMTYDSAGNLYVLMRVKESEIDKELEKQSKYLKKLADLEVEKVLQQIKSVKMPATNSTGE